MSKSVLTQKILIYEAVGFGLAIALLWVDELLDLPHHLLGAPLTAINWRESMLESGFALALAVATLVWTYRVLTRIQYLEGLLPVCSFCKKIRMGDRWVPFEEYITEHSEAVFSHGICPKCIEEHYSEVSEK